MVAVSPRSGAPRRGDVWWVELPHRSPRPAVVLTRDAVLPWLRYPLVAFTTTVVRGLPTEVPLDETDGMPRPSVVSLDNVETVSKALLVERVTRLSPARMRQVCDALAVAVQC